MTFEEKAEIVISQLRDDRDRLQAVLDRVKTEIEDQEIWLMQAGYNHYNVDIAFDAIKMVAAKGRYKDEYI